MICKDGLKLLTRLDENREKRIGLNSQEQLTLEELEKNDYVSQVLVEDFDHNELARARSELIQIQDKKKNLREKELESMALQEQVLRNHILALSELSSKKERSVLINGRYYSITYKGKELVENLIPRIKRIGIKQVNEFEQEMIVLNNTFASWAKRSFEILEYLSPQAHQIEEIHCRSVAIGLSSRSETAKELSDAFVFTLDSIGGILKNQERSPSIAECIILNLKNLSKESISSAISKFFDLKILAGNYASNEDCAIDCALLLYPLDHFPGDNDRFLVSALDIARKMDININFDARFEAALFIEVMGFELDDEIARKFQDQFNEMNSSTISHVITGIAAALIVVGIIEDQQVQSRFSTALEYLNRFSEAPMSVPAAMLSHLSPEIEETLDTLRLASSAIAKQKISLGGMENLSLGMKLLLQSSVISSLISIPAEMRKQYIFPHEMIPLQTLGILTFSMLPVALIAFTSFHDLSMHKLTVSDYGFHPVHTNYAYG